MRACYLLLLLSPRLVPLLLLLAVVSSPGAEAEKKRPDLTGGVRSTNGQPIPRASAFIYTAGPKVGIGFL